MKKSIIIITVLLSIAGILWYMQEKSQKTIVEIEALSYQLSHDVDLNTDSLEDSDEFSEIKALIKTQITINHRQKESLQYMARDIIAKHRRLKEQDQSYHINDRLTLKHTLINLRDIRLEYKQTYGKVYQKMIDLHQNQEEYTKETQLQILHEIYQTLQLRETLLEQAYQELHTIGDIILAY